MLHQQRLRFEDSRIKTRDGFRPDPRAVSLTWKFYSRFRDRCDLCRNPDNKASQSNGPTGRPGDQVGANSAQQQFVDDMTCSCAPDGQQQQSFGYDAEKSPLDKMPENMKLVTNVITYGPHEKYGHLPEPPLTSHMYGWQPADMYTGKYDQADWERFYHPHRLANYWY